MKKIHLLVAMATFFLLSTFSCTREQIGTEPEIAPQLSELQVLGYLSAEGFVQTASESDLLQILDDHRGDNDNLDYTSASIVQNGSLYMIKSPVIFPGEGEKDVWMHLEVVDEDVVFDPLKGIVKVTCSGNCNHCQYVEYPSCYECDCYHPFEQGSCTEEYLYSTY
jgi:hypothetical protein